LKTLPQDSTRLIILDFCEVAYLSPRAAGRLIDNIAGKYLIVVEAVSFKILCLLSKGRSLRPLTARNTQITYLIKESIMARIADYSIISDSKVSLKIGGDIDHTFSFSLPDDAHLGSQSILAFVAFISSDAKNLKFTIRVNSSEQVNHTFTGSRVNTIHEVITSNLLKHGSNTVIVNVESGQGLRYPR
jgi:hypothetical protein